MTRITIFPTPYSDGLDTTWRFHGLPQSFADHMFAYISKYTDQFRNEDGTLPPVPALSDWDGQRYGWVDLHPEIPAGLSITLVGETWDLDIMVPTKEDPHQWIDILYILKRVATMEFK